MGLLSSGSHESVPSIPDITGREIFQGLIMHTKSFRDPELFRNKTVVVLGMSFSGLDMMYAVSPVAKQVRMW
jgi:cation diffusion facilitator CzcD-associated flavoprotein CzcO